MKILFSTILFLVVVMMNGQTLTTSNLPIVILDTQGNTIKDEPKITANMKVIHNAGKDNSVNDNVFEYNGRIGIEVRGNTSQLFYKDKLSYTLETRTEADSNLNVSLMGMPKENDWVLYGPYSDKSLMRNVLAYYLGNATGRWSPGTRYCELLLNGEYKGIYILTEKIKIDKNRVDIANLKETDTNGDELTGGYIMSIDRDNEGSWNSPFLGRTGSVDVPFTYVDPKYSKLTNEQRAYIRNYITDFEYALDGPDYKDPEKGYRAYIDVISFIDYYLITELARDLDGYRVSVYFHKDKDSKGGKLTMSPMWDYNLCFGNADFFEADNPVGSVADGLGKGDWYEIPFWWDKLRQDPYFETYLKWRWESLRKNEFSLKSIDAVLDSCYNLIYNAQIRNFQRFNILNKDIWPNAYIGGTFENEVDYLKSWIYNRSYWMDAEIAAIVPAFVMVDEHEKIEEMKVETYPNPVIDRLHFKFSMFEEAEVTLLIYNAMGEVIYTQVTKKYPGVNVITLPADQVSSDDKLLIYELKSEYRTMGTGKILIQ